MGSFNQSRKWTQPKEDKLKKLATAVEVEGEGFEALLDKNVLVFGLNYIYTGKLVGVSPTFLKIEGAKIVYETGPFSDKQYKDAQSLPTHGWYVQISAIESFGIGR